MTQSSAFELVLTPPAVRALRSGLPESVAAAVIEFLTGALIENPQRVGKPLRGDLAGIHSAESRILSPGTPCCAGVEDFGDVGVVH